MAGGSLLSVSHLQEGSDKGVGWRSDCRETSGHVPTRWLPNLVTWHASWPRAKVPSFHGVKPSSNTPGSVILPFVEGLTEKQIQGYPPKEKKSQLWKTLKWHFFSVSSPMLISACYFHIAKTTRWCVDDQVSLKFLDYFEASVGSVWVLTICFQGPLSQTVTDISYLSRIGVIYIYIYICM